MIWPNLKPAQKLFPLFSLLSGTGFVTDFVKDYVSGFVTDFVTHFFMSCKRRLRLEAKNKNVRKITAFTLSAI